MNEHDRNNLTYIMSLNGKEFDEWASMVTEDDIKYAIELIQTRRLEIAKQEQEIEELMLEGALDESTFAEANAVLKKFML